MPRVVICPSCQSKGSIPDGTKVAKIRCPKCGQVFEVQGTTQPGSSTGKASRQAPKAQPPTAAVNSAFEDLESVQPLPSLSGTGMRRVGAGGAAPEAQSGSGQSPLLYAIVGAGGLVIVSL